LNFHFLTPIWGKDFTERYIEIFLPAQIENLQAFRDSVYKIVTTPESEEKIKQSTALARLSQTIKVQFLPLGDSSTDYGRMSVGYEIGMHDSPPDTAFFYLTPDSIWSRGSFERCRDLAAAGYRAVMVSGPRVSLEDFIADFGTRTSIDGRELAELSERHVHKIIRSFMHGQRFHNSHPAALYWEVAGGLVARHFVYHPLLVRPRKPVEVVRETLDYEIGALVPRRKIYVCTDSDDIFGVDVALRDYDQGAIRPGPLSEDHVVEWLLSDWPTAFHRWLGRHTVFVHSKPIGPDHLSAARMAEETLRRIYRRVPPLGFAYAPLATLKGIGRAPTNKARPSWYRKLLKQWTGESVPLN
jgi:hypothetical protein